MRDLKREIVWIASTGAVLATSGSGRIARREILAWGTSALLGAVATAAWMRNRRATIPEIPALKFSIPEQPGLTMNFFQTAPAISPDGRMLVFASDTSQLF